MTFVPSWNLTLVSLTVVNRGQDSRTWSSLNESDLMKASATCVTALTSLRGGTTLCCLLPYQLLGLSPLAIAARISNPVKYMRHRRDEAAAATLTMPHAMVPKVTSGFIL